MPRSVPLVFLLASLFLTQSGCVLYAPEIAQTKQALEAEHPEAHFEQQTMLDLGPVSLWMAGHVMRLTAREDYARLRPYLPYLQRVQIGIYQTNGSVAPQGIDPATLPPLREDAWEVAVHTQQPPDEQTWILYRPAQRDALRDLYVFTLNKDELVALHLNGQIDQLAWRYLEEHDVLNGLLRSFGRASAAP